MRLPDGFTLTQAVRTLSFITYVAGYMINLSHTEGVHIMLLLKATDMSCDGADVA